MTFLIELNTDESKMNEFVSPIKLWRRSELLISPSPIPRSAGIYGWYFKNLPTIVPTAGTVIVDDFALLYIGIAPSSEKSLRTLRCRLRDHVRKDASQSTLRLTLGCLLSKSLGIDLRVQKNDRLTFGVEGESRLSTWLEENAVVTWLAFDKPWLDEGKLIQKFNTPFNLKGNQQHPFFPVLSDLRNACKASARTQ